MHLGSPRMAEMVIGEKVSLEWVLAFTAPYLVAEMF